MITMGMSSGFNRSSPVHSSVQAAQGQCCRRYRTGYLALWPSLQVILNTPFSNHSISVGSSTTSFIDSITLSIKARRPDGLDLKPHLTPDPHWSENPLVEAVAPRRR